MKSHFFFVLWIILTVQFVINRAAFGVIKWNKGSGEFEPIPGLPTYDIQTEKRTWQSRQEETHNFYGQPLYLTYYQELGFLHFSENNTKVSGIYGDMWNILSEMLNFTLVVKRSEVNSLGSVNNDNGSFNGILEDVRLNRIDIIPKMEIIPEVVDVVRFTTPFWMNSYRIFAYEQWRRDRDWVFKQFTVDVWFLVFIFIVIFSIVSLTMQKVWARYRSDICPMLRTCFLDHIFDTLATICNQGNVLASTSNGMKIITVTVSTFFWIIMTAYGARLMYSMTNEVFAPPYTDIETLYRNTKLHVVVMNGTLGHEAFDVSTSFGPNIYTILSLIGSFGVVQKIEIFMSGYLRGGSQYSPINSIQYRMKKAKRMKVVSTIQELNEKICLNSEKYVLLDGIDDVMVRSKSVCAIVPANSESFNVFIASGISKRVENKKSIDIGIVKMIEFGISKAIKNRYLPLGRKESQVRQTDSLAIDLNQFLIVLAVLSTGFIASIVICVAENIFYALKHNKNSYHFRQQRPVSERLLFVRNISARNSKSAN